MAKAKTIQQFIKEASKIHNNKYNYEHVIYINNQTKVIIVCPIHGEFTQTPHSHVTNNRGCNLCKRKKCKTVNNKSIKTSKYLPKFDHIKQLQKQIKKKVYRKRNKPKFTSSMKGFTRLANDNFRMRGIKHTVADMRKDHSKIPWMDPISYKILFG